MDQDLGKGIRDFSGDLKETKFLKHLYRELECAPTCTQMQSEILEKDKNVGVENLDVGGGKGISKSI